ncbi:PRC-barrel domain-containing protein [Rhizobium sp. L1K21]|uniref:PRC-barrel domain-containing protein n=1 Tax=Rhizobium sp. L1K21 TaxID=2954933 RepID=UPI002092497F|nr:PRC-barrel domain-containing protein [Rhizobium sp. L1K21]MCO6187775.1 PRC-barrel domain-containing protein [Rhizobium sp. L1K21]
MRKLETALAVILMASPAVAAQQNTADNTAKSNNQQEVDRAENAVFSRWDTNNDQRLENQEFVSGLHDAWSGDNDQIDQAAFDENWNNWFTAEKPDFSEIDENDDGQLSQDELNTAVNEANLQDNWQGAEDSYLTPEEFRAGMQSVNDRNRDGTLDQQETEGLLTIVEVIVPADTQTASQNSQADPSEVRVGNVISLRDWDTDSLYGSTWSAEALFDRNVYSPGGEEIGDVEDLIVGSDGTLLALVAEVGGFWDIGDTHVSIPWNQVSFRDDGSLTVPVTEENADDFSIINTPSKQQLSGGIVSNLDDRDIGLRAWRASELIGDRARVHAGTDQVGDQTSAGSDTTMNSQSANYRDFGYVQDLLFDEGKIAAAVVEVAPGYGVRGRFAYPYYGYEYGWTPGSQYYDLPYTGDEAATVEPLNQDRLNDES